MSYYSFEPLIYYLQISEYCSNSKSWNIDETQCWYFQSQAPFLQISTLKQPKATPEVEAVIGECYTQLFKACFVV